MEIKTKAEKEKEVEGGGEGGGGKKRDTLRPLVTLAYRDGGVAGLTFNFGSNIVHVSSRIYF